MEFSNAFLVLVPVVIGLVSVVKAIGMDARFAPLLAVVFGVFGAFVLAGVSGGTAIGGIVAGLSASGLYSGTRTTLGV